MTPNDAAPAMGASSAEWGAITPAKNDGVIAVLGPTNTGKTHYAVERMLGHKNGVIGFPLRLLAREIFDRIVLMRGPRDVALITGEEKIVPPDARYYICTVESMPLDWGAEFVAVDEIQLCADPERGHVFTDRLLHARGRSETLFLGALTMWDRIASLAPGARFVTRERMSQLTYAGSKKLSRLPARSAVVGFSVDNVYAIAELIRRQKGGAAVVMGALSPRTRNAQVALYQEGDVDYLIATDAIGMGLNLDVRHVAFSGLRKFDGRRHRLLEPNELAQIAGRAGRHTNDGTFGVTGEAPPLEDEAIQAIENHKFKPIERVQWRNASLDYATPHNLMLSLDREPPSPELCRAREADDVVALRHLARMPDIQDIAHGRNRVRLLWDVCQVPDFRKTMPSEHAALLAELYRFLTSDDGVIPEDWIAAQCDRLDFVDGDIDALSKRLAYIRTWTYVANRVRWLGDPGHWRGRTRDIEDKLSDALHARLTQRFVDRRTSVLARRLKQKEALVAIVDDAGAVTVEGEFVGRLEGFRFEPDPTAAGAEVKTLQAASAQALQAELGRRVDKFYSAPDSEIDVTEQGGMMWGASAVGRLEAAPENAADPLGARAVAFADDMLEAPLREKIERRLQFWIDRKIQAAFEPLIALKDDATLTGLARGVAFQLVERFGVSPRPKIAEDLKALAQDARAALRKHGVRFGQHTVFIPTLLKPAPTRLRVLLWGLSSKLAEIPSPPPPGAVTIPIVPQALSPEQEATYYAMAGYRRCGPRALRVDMLERLADMIRGQDARAGFEATPEMLSITGATLDQFAEMMEGLGFVAEKGERPKQPKPRAEKSDKRGRAGAKATAEAAGETPTGTAASEAEATPAAEAGPTHASPEADGATPPVMDGSAAEPSTDSVAEALLEADQGAPAETRADEASPEVAEAADVANDAASAEVVAEAIAETTVETTDEAQGEADIAAAAAQPADQPLADERAATETTQAPVAETIGAAGANEATEPSQEVAVEAAAEATPEGAEDAAEDAAAIDPSAPVEMEAFYIFRLAPRRGRGRGAEAAGGQRRGRRGGQSGQPAGAPTGDREHGRPDDGRGRERSGRERTGQHAGDGATTARTGEARPHEERGRPNAANGAKHASGKGPGKGSGKGPGKGRGKPQGRPGGKGSDNRKPREYNAGAQKSAKVDPDSPFAILQQLKDSS